MAISSKFSFLVVVILVTFSFLSCNNENCMGNSNAIPLAAFYQGDNAVSLKGLTVYGIGAPNDSCIISDTTASQVYMPLRIDTGSCKYVFEYNTDGLDNDTIALEYESLPYFESHECGAMYNFKITSFDYTNNAIDSVAIPNPRITNDDVVTIKIYMQ